MKEPKINKPCQFAYVAKDGQPVYQDKFCDFTIHSYNKKDAGRFGRTSIGFKKLNLSEYIGLGPVTETIRMDLKTDEDVYLTYQLMVLNEEEYQEYVNSEEN